jgi:predicted DNA-binding protein
MNTSKLARTSFVLDRETHDQLQYLSRRMGVSRSELVRDVLAEPISLMAKWMLSVPDDPTGNDAERVEGQMQLDMVEFLSRKAEEVRQTVIQ